MLFITKALARSLTIEPEKESAGVTRKSALTVMLAWFWLVMVVPGSKVKSVTSM